MEKLFSTQCHPRIHIIISLLFLLNLAPILGQTTDSKLIEAFKSHVNSKFDNGQFASVAPCKVEARFVMINGGLNGQFIKNGTIYPITFKNLLKTENPSDVKCLVEIAGATCDLTIGIPAEANEVGATGNERSLIIKVDGTNEINKCSQNGTISMDGEVNKNVSLSVPVPEKIKKSDLKFDKITNTYSFNDKPYSGTINENTTGGGCNEYQFSAGKLRKANISAVCGKGGTSTKYYPNGNKEEENTSIDIGGVTKRSFTRWWENGKMRTKGDFINDKMHGQWQAWYENGQKMNESTYTNGTQIKVTAWDEAGKIITK